MLLLQATSGVWALELTLVHGRKPRTPLCSVSPAQGPFSISRSPGPPRFILGCRHLGDKFSEACRGVLTSIRKARIVDSTCYVDSLARLFLQLHPREVSLCGYEHRPLSREGSWYRHLTGRVPCHEGKAHMWHEQKKVVQGHALAPNLSTADQRDNIGPTYTSAEMC